VREPATARGHGVWEAALARPVGGGAQEERDARSARQRRKSLIRFVSVPS
jgi:hypothetical protein